MFKTFELFSFQTMTATVAGHKILLLGRENAGKTSMKCIIFANYLAKEIRLPPTIRIARTRECLLDLKLDIWDCGGQPLFMKSYFESQRPLVFNNVKIVIYVVDVQTLSPNSHNVTKQMKRSFTGHNEAYEFNDVLGAINQYSPNAKIFCLIHKMDTIPMKHRENVFVAYADKLQNAAKTYKQNVTCFATSIWDETLFKAWSYVVTSLFNDRIQLKHELNILCNKCRTNEIILFESKTFLWIEHSKRITGNVTRLERIANIIKQFKLKCMRANQAFQSMVVSGSKFAVYIGPFTKNTYLLAVIRDPNIEIEAVKINLNNSRSKFEKLLQISCT
eukprot:46267_1